MNLPVRELNVRRKTPPRLDGIYYSMKRLRKKASTSQSNSNSINLDIILHTILNQNSSSSRPRGSRRDFTHRNHSMTINHAVWGSYRSNIIYNIGFFPPQTCRCGDAQYEREEGPTTRRTGGAGGLREHPGGVDADAIGRVEV